MNKDIIYSSLFEDDYLQRTISGSITNQPDVALTELVANAWDAGARNVIITLPTERGGYLMVEDDGTGLTEDEFQSRWMTLSYNRLKRQGQHVVFPSGDEYSNIVIRQAYGHNGIGRHGMLCFNDEYELITNKDNIELSVNISTTIANQPLAVLNKTISENVIKRHGTLLRVIVNRHLPDESKIREILSSRFLHDPQFEISINKQVLNLDQLEGLLDKTELTTPDGYVVTANFIDSQTSAKKSIYQGIAFWNGKRLVGVPSWQLGSIYNIDGRTIPAKRYTFIIQSDNLGDFIKADWSGFISCPEVDNLFKTVRDYVLSKLEDAAFSNLEETKRVIKQELKSKLTEASPLVLYEIDEVIENISLNNPTASRDSLTIAAEAVINLEASKNGQELLAKLAKLNECDISALNTLLEKWTVKDALVVLNEIDKRLSIIEAIRKLSTDSSVDELHILHPLVTEARWLFGPEYDTPEYTSNRQLQTVVKSLFKGKIDDSVDVKITNRPDIVVLSDSSMFSLTCTEEYNPDSGLVDVKKILIIELKKGGFDIKRKERQQASDYVEDLIALGYSSSIFNAYVVGHSVAKELQRYTTIGNPEQGRIYVTTFSQLVDTAERRMFGLRDKLSSMYDDIP